MTWTDLIGWSIAAMVATAAAFGVLIFVVCVCIYAGLGFSEAWRAWGSRNKRSATEEK